MNYGIWIIVLSIINVLTVFSGLPTGTKKGVFVVTTLFLLCIGFILKAVDRKRKALNLAKTERIEASMHADMETVAKTIAHDVEEHVEEEIENLTNHDHHHNHTYDQHHSE